MNKLVATYSRVSTAKQEEEQTIKIQIENLKEFAEKGDANSNYIIVENYVDEGWSGDTLARPALDKLRIDAKSKKFEIVLIYDPDRLARRSAWQEVVIEELKELEIDVLFITIPPAKTDEDKIMNKMRGVFSEYERMKIKERFRLGKVRKVKDGHLLVSSALYGYDYVQQIKDGINQKVHGYYKINEVEAVVVKNIFDWVAIEGLTLRTIVRRLQDLGIKPKKSKRGVWSTSTLSHLLRNKAYIGEAHWGSSYAVIPQKPLKIEKYKKNKKTSRKIKPESEWIIISVPVIIEKDVFERVGQVLKDNNSLSKRNKKNSYLLSGKIYCSCGKRRVGEGPQHGKFLYYRCTDRVNSFPLPRTCMKCGLNARTTDDKVWKGLHDFMLSPKLLSEQIEVWLNDKKLGNPSQFNDLSIFENEVKRLKEQEDKYTKGYVKGVFSLEQIEEYFIPIRERLSKLNTQISEIKQQENQGNTVLPSEEEIENFCREIAGYLEGLSFDQKRAIITRIVDKIVGSEEEVVISGAVPIPSIDSIISPIQLLGLDQILDSIKDPLSSINYLNNHVKLLTSYRNRRFTKRRKKHSF